MDRAIAVVAISVTALVAAIILAVTPSTPDWSKWYVITLLGAGGLLLIVASNLGARDRRSRPRLVIGSPTVELRGIVHESRRNQPTPMTTTTPTTSLAVTGVYPTTHFDSTNEMVYGAYVHILNQPHIPGRAAEDVVARLRFLSSDGRVTEMHGRWSELPQHGDPERTLEPEGLTIPSNGRPKWLDVAIKYLNDAECFAFNDESRFRSPADLRYRPLGQSPIRVEVTARGSNCREANATFTLSHKGKDSRPVLEQALRSST